MRTLRAIGVLGLLAVMLGGCMDRDPYRRTDVWRPTGANAANLAAQVADPADLLRGRGAARIDTVASTAAINRLQTDNPRPINPAARQSGLPAASPPSSGGGSLPGGSGISLAPPEG